MNCFFYAKTLASENSGILSEVHSFNIHDLNTYTSFHTIEGVNLADESMYFYVSVREGGELLNLELAYKEGSKLKKIRIDKTTISSDVSYGSFFNGVRTYMVPIDGEKQYHISYSVKENHAVFISTMYKSGYYNSLQTQYEFNFPANLAVSSSNGEKYTESFTLSNQDFHEDTSKMYLLVHPKDSDKEVYFSNWFSERINTINQLKPANIPEKLIALSKTASKVELAEAYFKFVQHEVRYLDIENGINAIIPRDCNYVLENKFGDCKDMANTLVSLLKHFGFEAYNCVSKTNSNDWTFNFPTLGQANHMIVGLKLKDEWIFLDPTESNCLFGDPSIQILGTEAFAIGHQANFFIQVPSSPKSKTEVHLVYDLDLKNKKIKVKIDLHGKTNTLLVNKKDDAETMDTLSNRLFSYSLPLTNQSINDTLSTLLFEGNLPNAFLAELSSKTLVQTSFLANTQILFVLSGYRSFPVFPMEISSLIHFDQISCEKIQTKGVFWISNCTENKIEHKDRWNAFVSKDKFEESKEWLDYKTDFTKPIIILTE
jgi:hypothetical protein